MRKVKNKENTLKKGDLPIIILDMAINNSEYCATIVKASPVIMNFPSHYATLFRKKIHATKSTPAMKKKSNKILKAILK